VKLMMAPGRPARPVSRRRRGVGFLLWTTGSTTTWAFVADPPGARRLLSRAHATTVAPLSKEDSSSASSETQKRLPCSSSRSADETPYRSGFVAVVGSANVGKSTLVNALVGERLCIATSKAQTTRHRVLGVATTPTYQMALTDTPGVIHDAPAYALQRGMMGAARRACRDAEVVLLLTDIFEISGDDAAASIARWLDATANAEAPVVVAVNKVDLLRYTDEHGDPLLGPVASDLVGSEERAMARARALFGRSEKTRDVVPLSAARGDGVEALTETLVGLLPVSPPVYPDEDADFLTDRPSRFFAAEIIREQILEHYTKEIPYACEVQIDRFKEDQLPDRLDIAATINVNRDSQKGILIGKHGRAIKETGTAARQRLEAFFDVPKVFLDLKVKVKKNWRSDENALRAFGYLD